MSYQSQKEKIMEYFDNKIFPSMKFNTELDYNKLISTLVSELMVSEKQVEEVLRVYVHLEKIKEFRFFTFCEKKQGEMLKATHKQTEKDIKEVFNNLETKIQEEQNGKQNNIS